eukprot:4322213-Pleurochrysis_carterae.AAC.2
MQTRTSDRRIGPSGRTPSHAIGNAAGQCAGAKHRQRMSDAWDKETIVDRVVRRASRNRGQ